MKGGKARWKPASKRQRKVLPSKATRTRLENRVTRTIANEPKVSSIISLSSKRASAKSEHIGYCASIYLGPGYLLEPEFCTAVLKLQKALKMPLLLLIQHHHKHYLGEIDEELFRLLISRRQDLPKRPLGLVIDSLGGQSRYAFRIAKLLKHQCGRFTALVPRIAKSGATLLALGADHLQIAPFAELGPLDAQVCGGPDRGWHPALDDVRVLERLQTSSLEVLDRTMFLLHSRTSKKTDYLLPLSSKFVSDLMRPLFEKINVNHYSRSSQPLKDTEEYAIRLLRRRLPEQAAEIASQLVMNYPDHMFVIDHDEAIKLGLAPDPTLPELEALFDAIEQHAGKENIIGELCVSETKETR